MSAIEEARFQLEMQPEIEASSDTDSLCDDGERLAYGQVKPGVYTLQEDTELVQAVDVIERWIDSTTTVDQPDDEQQTPNDSLNVSADDVRNTGDIVSLLVDLEDRRSAGNQEVTLLDNDDSVEFCMDNDDDIIEEDDGITYEEHHLEDEADEGDDLELVQHSEAGDSATGTPNIPKICVIADLPNLISRECSVGNRSIGNVSNKCRHSHGAAATKASSNAFDRSNRATTRTTFRVRRMPQTTEQLQLVQVSYAPALG